MIEEILNEKINIENLKPGMTIRIFQKLKKFPLKAKKKKEFSIMKA